MPSQKAVSLREQLDLLGRRNMRFAMPAVMLTFAGAFSAFTYFRPFLEVETHVSLLQLSLLLFGLGMAGFIGTRGATAVLGKHLYRLLRWLPFVLALVTVVLLEVGSMFWPVAIALIVWGAVNAAIPVSWSAWIAHGISDQPESGGGLIVAAIQLSILLGGALGGALLDHVSIDATFWGGAS